MAYIVSQGSVANPAKQTYSVVEATKTHAKNTLKFTEALLKRLPEVIDTNPAKVVAGIIKIALQIKDVCRRSSIERLTNYST